MAFAVSANRGRNASTALDKQKLLCKYEKDFQMEVFMSDQATQKGGRLYQTKQRQAILDFLKTQDRALAATEVYQQMKAQGIQVGLTTVYRSLCKMTNNGLLRQVWTGTAEAVRFEIAPHAPKMHVHLHCAECGNDEEMDCEALSELSEHFEAEHHFHIQTEDLVLNGLCASCRQSAEADPPPGKETGSTTN